MFHISIVSSSVRKGRKSHHVALYLKNYLTEKHLASVEILDLKEYSFPVFTEALKNQTLPTPEVLDFAGKIRSADGIIIVTPEYNGGYPASLKNVIDLLYDEWHGKPISIATVSAGDFGGTQALVSLQFSLWKIGAWTVSNVFQVAKVEKAFDEMGNAIDKNTSDPLVDIFVKKLLENIGKNYSVRKF
jgi:NAD(P)H-dependent FMN reductase